MSELPRPSFTENAIRILERRYLRKDSQGRVCETPEEMLWRVARAVASAEEKWSEDPAQWEASFYEMMAHLDFLPNSPTLMNAGTGVGQLSACFVLPVGDSMEEIFDALKYTALIHKSGGGTGFNFSSLRPAGDVVKSTMGVASGPVSFMELFDHTTEVVKQGGMRRGANMGILNCDHPDIERFISAKSEEGRLSNFNISVGASDTFIEAIKKGDLLALTNPRTGSEVSKISARDLFEEIAGAAWMSGDPGMIFLDKIEAANPTPHLGRIDATNPCVPADTFVMTDAGPRLVKDLIGERATLIVDGKLFETTEAGFFKTGVKPLLSIRTKEGYSFRATAEHPVLRVTKKTRHTLQKEWINVSDLKPGDEIMLHDHRELAGWEGLYGEKEGYLMGLLVGDGTLKSDKAVLSVWPYEKACGDGTAGIMGRALEAAEAMPHRSDFQGWWKVSGRGEYRMSLATLRGLAFSLGMKPGEKTITPHLETMTSSQFARGFLQGLFDSDGSVQGSQKKGISIRLAQSDIKRLEAVQRMLARFGIVSVIYKNRRPSKITFLPDGENGVGSYETRPQHELVISRDNVRLFAERVGFCDGAKSAKLSSLLASYRRTPNSERFTATVESISSAGTEDVYDVQVPGANAFDANGIVVHNCGEQPLLPYESCNLGSINLVNMLDEKGSIDWDRLFATTKLAVRFLDDVIEINNFIIPQIKDATLGNRKIGLGVMGWADLLFKLGIPYDSDEALDLARKVMSFIQKTGHDESSKLAASRGPFPNWKGSRWEERGLPMRNATVTTIAPTGTISLIAECSSGIEPVFALAHRRKAFGGSDLLTYTNEILMEALRKNGLADTKVVEAIMEKGSLKEIDLPEEIKRVFVVAHDIHFEWHVRMQAAFQEFTDNAVSKTINMPREATVDDVKKAYFLAYELGCRGITIFRDGCKEDQVLHVGVSAEKQKIVAEEAIETGEYVKPKKRPAILSGKTTKIGTNFGNLYLTVNFLDGKPFEVFATLGKSGRDTQAHTEALGRLISLALRSGVPVDDIIRQLKGIGGGMPFLEDNDLILSLPDAIARGLERALGRSVEVKGSGDMCPVCGASLVYAEGCERCTVCDYSRCN
ncbi:MAG TPA: ribonucleotide reductase N-terminal alpha domain-containing protein [Thermosynergistes sp.]|nr:ribonucleotide reductase N-terminal alpha domain-containing protein [Thermosynergistes sp.]